MGSRVALLATQDSELQLVYGLESEAKSSAGFPIGPDATQIKTADVVIDFSIPDATLALLKSLGQYKKPVVIGTTGFSAEQDAKIKDLAKVVPVVKSANMSLGVNVFFKVAEAMAKALPGYTVHIEETHHIHKKDKPSGTALQAGRLIEEATGQKATYASLREGEVIGDHRVILSGPLDRIELFHHADSRDIFAVGSLHAAKWVVGKAPGLYSMQDVLGL